MCVCTRKGSTITCKTCGGISLPSLHKLNVTRPRPMRKNGDDLVFGLQGGQESHSVRGLAAKSPHPFGRSQLSSQALGAQLFKMFKISLQDWNFQERMKISSEPPTKALFLWENSDSEGPRIETNQSWEAFNTERNLQSRMALSFQAPLSPQKSKARDWNFQAKMNISNREWTFQARMVLWCVGQWFCHAFERELFFFDLRSLWEGRDWNLQARFENAPTCYRAPRWPDPEFFRKIPVSVKFVSAILGPETAAPILWTPGKNAFFLQEKTCP